MFKITHLTAPFLIFFVLGLSVNSHAKVFSDKEYGYLFHYPENWIAGTYRSGVVLSETTSRSRQAGVQIRMRDLRNDTNQYITSYIRTTRRALNATLTSQHSGKRNGIEYHEMEFDSVRGELKTYLYHALLFFPEQNKVLVIQAGCLDNVKRHYAPLIKEVAKSLWVYNANKMVK